MIWYDDILIRNPDEALNYDFTLLDTSHRKFFVPRRIKGNNKKSVYKSGFLVEFLNHLYNKKTMNEIVLIMQEEFHVFLSKRQIERNRRSFLKNHFFRN